MGVIAFNGTGKSQVVGVEIRGGSDVRRQLRAGDLLTVGIRSDQHPASEVSTRWPRMQHDALQNVRLRGLLGLALLILVAGGRSRRHRRGIRVRTVLAALGLQVVFAILVLRWPPGERALSWAADRVQVIIGFTEEGTAFVFGPLLEVGEKDNPIFALQVLPVIIFLGALIYLLLHPRPAQWVTFVIGGAIARLLGVSKVRFDVRRDG